MKKRVLLAFIFLIVLVHFIYLHHNVSILTIETGIKTGSLLLFGLLILFPRISNSRDNPAERLWKNWCISFLAFFIMILSLVIYINPHGRFPWQYYPFTVASPHYRKMNLFKKSSDAPRVIILGSSHAFTIPADYVSHLMNVRTFNMAVGYAGPVDELMLTRFVLDQGRRIPAIVVVEVVATDLGTFGWRSAPVRLLPYLPNNLKMEVVDNIFLDTISLQSLSDSVFLLAGFGNTVENITFLPDGTGVRNFSSTKASYKKQVRLQIPRIYKQHNCFSLDEQGMNAYEEMAALSQEYNFGLIFYRSPLNDEYFKKIDETKPSYQKCQSLFAKYMQTLTDQYPNVYYIDLLKYEQIGGLGYAGYIDAQHLRPNASRRLVDTLLPTLQKALIWVQGIR